MAKKLKTINDYEDGCYFCGGFWCMEVHHIFGASNRKHSEEDGLCVWLCRLHHNMAPDGVHYNKKKMDELRRVGQKIYEKDHSHEEFMARYGRNYL